MTTSESDGWQLRTTDGEFHETLVKELYDLACTRAKDRWPIAASTLHRRMVHAALLSAYMRAFAENNYCNDRG